MRLTLSLLQHKPVRISIVIDRDESGVTEICVLTVTTDNSQSTFTIVMVSVNHKLTFLLTIGLYSTVK